MYFNSLKNNLAAHLLVLFIIGGFLLPLPAYTYDFDSEDENRGRAVMKESSSVRPVFAVSQPIDAEKYICGVGDQFIITIWGKKEAEILVGISPEGDLVIPSIGKIRNLVGKTLKEVKGKIRWKIETVYTNVSYAVDLARPRTFLINVAGYAKSPGEHSATAITRVSQFVRKIGGANKYGSGRFVEVWRKGELHSTVDFFSLYRFGKIDQDVYLLEGALVKFPIRGRRVKVTGAVEVPGEYELLENENLKSLIQTQCAGTTRDLADRDPVEIVRRLDSDQFKVYRIGLPEMESKDVELLDRDQIYIPTLNRYQKVIRIQGAVVGTGALTVESKKLAASSDADKERSKKELLPGSGFGGQVKEFVGVYPFIEGETVSKVLERAGGVTPEADTGNAFIRRPVPKKQKEFETIPVNLTAILIEKDFSKDVEVKAGDFLIVPSIEDRVFIIGEVVTPGSQYYSPYYTARYYVGLAGGQTNRASLYYSRVIHQDGTKEKLDMNSIIGPGDTIFLKEKTFKFWQDYWAILTGAAAIVLSGFAVLYATQYGNN